MVVVLVEVADMVVELPLQIVVTEQVIDGCEGTVQASIYPSDAIYSEEFNAHADPVFLVPFSTFAAAAPGEL